MVLNPAIVNETPAVLYDETRIIQSLEIIKKLQSILDFKFLFPLKSCSVLHLLSMIEPYTQGFSASSLFEAQLARDILHDRKLVHVTTPCLRPSDFTQLLEISKSFTFNSLEQFSQYRDFIPRDLSIGLRVNPQLSFVKDERYNPCRKYSKLGISIKKLSHVVENTFKDIEGVNGILFHTNCESIDFDPLFKTIKHIDTYLSRLLSRIDWINLGGGYLFNNSQLPEGLVETVEFLANNYNVDIFFEPGKAIIGDAGYIISSVVDIFESDGRQIAILDTSVNHAPEVFEYQYKPDILEESHSANYNYVLAGASCLAGDLFGEYSFNKPLETGSRIIFQNMGAYTLVKANMFNGINMPTIYLYTQNGDLKLIKRFDYDDFLSRCGVN